MRIYGTNRNTSCFIPGDQHESQELPAPKSMAVGGAERLRPSQWGCGEGDPAVVITSRIRFAGLGGEISQ